MNAHLLVRPRKDHHGVNLISEALPFSPVWYGEPNAISNAIDYAKFRSRSHHAVIRVYNEAGKVVETHEHAGDFKEYDFFARITSEFPLKQVSMIPLLWGSSQQPNSSRIRAKKWAFLLKHPKIGPNSR
jgi:hypothetical protein